MTGAYRRAGWWQAENRKLFGWIHVPATGRVRSAAVLCSPLLDEHYWSDATYRYLADHLAKAGVAALRFDYFGMGDSAGRAPEVGTVEEWRSDMRAAVKELRRRGARDVAVVALRAAANLAVGDVAGADALVLWDPVSNGRSFVRQAILLHHQATGADEPRVPLAEDSAPLLGYAFPPSFRQSLEDIGPCTGVDVPTLVLTRSGEAPIGLTAGPRLEIQKAEGQQQMLNVLLDAAAIPSPTVSNIVAWMLARAPTATHAFGPALEETLVADGYTELTQTFGPDGSLFGIVTEPAGRGPNQPLTCLMLNSGVQSHVGPNRLHVDLARELAPDGVRSVRFDFRGIGDSALPDGAAHSVYAASCLDDLDAVSHAFSPAPIAAIGLCSGGYYALELARRSTTRGVVAINISPEIAEVRRGAKAGRKLPPVIEQISDRAWVRAARRTWLGRAVIWRVPGWGWWVLDRFGFQPDLTRGLRAAGRDGSEVVALIERRTASLPRCWPLLHRRRAVALLTVHDADHALTDPNRRGEVAARCHAALMRWRPARSPGLVVSARSTAGPSS